MTFNKAGDDTIAKRFDNTNPFIVDHSDKSTSGATKFEGMEADDQMLDDIYMDVVEWPPTALPSVYLSWNKNDYISIFNREEWLKHLR